MKQFLRHIFLFVAMFVVTTNVWAEKQIVELLYTDNLSSDFDDDELKKITQGTAVENNVKFTISNSKSYDNGAQEYLYFDQLDKNSSRTETFSWTIDKQNTSYPFRVEVQKVQCKIKGYQAVISTKTANAFFSGESATDCKTNNLSVDDSYKTISTSDSRIVGTSITLNMQSSGQKTTFHLQDIRYTYKIYQEVPLFQYKAKVIADPNGGGVVSVSWDNLNFQYSENEAMAVVTWSKKDVLDVATGGEAKTAYFKAEPKDGYQFVGWTYDPNSTAEPISTNPIYSVSNIKSYTNDDAMDPQVTLYAIFKSKKQPVVRGNDIADVKVDTRVSTGFVFENVMFPLDTLTNGEVDFYYMINHYPDNTSKADSPDPSKVIYYDVDRNEIVALNSGYAIITFNHKDSESYYALPEPKSFKVTVGKHTPVFTLNPEVSSSPEKLYFNKDYPDYFTTTADTRLTITSSDTLVAKWVQGSNSQSYTLKTFSKTSVATLTAIQHENYYWYPLEGSVDIQLQNARNHVPLKIESEADMRALRVDNNHNLTWKGGVDLQGGDYADKFYVFKFEGYPKEITFKYKVNSDLTSGEYWSVEQSDSNGNWSDATKWVKDGGESGEGSLQLNENTRYIRLCYSGNGHGLFYDIEVSRLEEFYASEVDTKNKINTLNFDIDPNGDPKENQVGIPHSLSFDFHYANIGHDVKLSTNDPEHFTISQTSFKNIGGEKVGKEKITVTYSSPNEYTAIDKKLYITDELGNKYTIALTASSVKATQTLTWQGIYDAEKPVVRISEGAISNLATASSGLQVTYRSSDETIIKVSEDSLSLIPLQMADAVEITAIQKGNNVWNEVKETKTFRITDKLTQLILWPSTLSDLVIGGENIALDAKVYVVNDETGEYTFNESLTSNLHYEVENTNVVAIEEGVLKIKGIGETYLTITAPGNTDYAEASLKVFVRVRAESTECEDYLLSSYYTNEELRYFQMNLNAIQHDFEIDRTYGEPGRLT